MAYRSSSGWHASFWEYIIIEYNNEAKLPGSDIPVIPNITDIFAWNYTLYLNCAIVNFMHNSYGKMPGSTNKNWIVMELKYHYDLLSDNIPDFVLGLFSDRKPPQ